MAAILGRTAESSTARHGQNNLGLGGRGDARRDRAERETIRAISTRTTRSAVAPASSWRADQEGEGARGFVILEHVVIGVLEDPAVIRARASRRGSQWSFTEGRGFPREAGHRGMGAGIHDNLVPGVQRRVKAGRSGLDRGHNMDLVRPLLLWLLDSGSWGSRTEDDRNVEMQVSIWLRCHPPFARLRLGRIGQGPSTRRKMTTGSFFFLLFPCFSKPLLKSPSVPTSTNMWLDP
jgi:hypothetical protein